MNIITVGSKNKAKVKAVKELVDTYDAFDGFEVIGMAVDSGVAEQPYNLKEMITGAKNRAVAAFKDCKYSIGLESGIITPDEPDGDYMELTVAMIYDGEHFYPGYSSAFKLPNKMVRIMQEQGVDMSAACKIMGLTTEEKIGEQDGLVGLMTGDRVTRKDYTVQALIFAFGYLETLHQFDV